MFANHSGNDHILPSTCEGKRLRRKLPKCEVRSFKDNGHCLFLVCSAAFIRIQWPNTEYYLTYKMLREHLLLLLDMTGGRH